MKKSIEMKHQNLQDIEKKTRESIIENEVRYESIKSTITHS